MISIQFWRGFWNELIPISTENANSHKSEYSKVAKYEEVT